MNINDKFTYGSEIINFMQNHSGTEIFKDIDFVNDIFAEDNQWDLSINIFLLQFILNILKHFKPISLYDP